MSAPRLPADQASRDDAVRQIRKSIFLEAGAGAGKTRVMVDRIVQTVADGYSELRQIAAITFTEKAAGELRARVRPLDLYPSVLFVATYQGLVLDMYE